MQIELPTTERSHELPDITDVEGFMRFVMSYPVETDDSPAFKIKLFLVWNAVEKAGGFEHIYQFELWEELQASHRSLTESLGSPLFEFYRDHLLVYYLSQKLNDTSFVETFDSRVLKRLLIYSGDREVDYFSEEFRNAPAIVIKDSFKRWNLNKNLYSDANIAKKYGSKKVRTLEQNPLGNSFKIKSKEMLMKEQFMTVKEYLEYRETLRDIKITSRDLPKRVKFAVNVDINSWNDIMEDLEAKIPTPLLFKSNDDILSLLRQEIEGITIPQIYLKVAGCWTGGHEENLRIRAININTGDGDVEWYFVDAEFVPLFRQIVKQESRIDILKEEGRWYTDLTFCLRHNIPVAKYIQRPGDTVVLRPGCLHWVRSLENTSNVAWNLGLYELQQLELIYSRYVINCEITFQSLLPVKTFFLDLLNCSWSNFDHASRQ